ncbi:MAG: hypothetical protein HKN82_12495 [Akkermansiaceae bacterium]|nr:hypothetical protein [Akkermansiaceae bacterium]NNM28277.1 hypothetical protein [Akkermansiaceae bacterium]
MKALSASILFLALTGIVGAGGLPGKTLNKKRALKFNAQVAFSQAPSPVCPYIGQTLRYLMNYARANHPDLYRQALGLRRDAGFTQEQVRVWLENQLCVREGYGPVGP